MNTYNPKYIFSMTDSEFEDYLNELRDHRMRSNGKATKGYRYRGLPCTGRTWHVGGCVTNDDGSKGGGVLEWCDSEHDAMMMMKEMERFEEFSELNVSELNCY